MGEAGDVAAGMRKARYHPPSDRIAEQHKNDRDAARLLVQCQQRSAAGEEHIRLQPEEFPHDFPCRVVIGRVMDVEAEVASLDPAEIAELAFYHFNDLLCLRAGASRYQN